VGRKWVPEPVFGGQKRCALGPSISKTKKGGGLYKKMGEGQSRQNHRKVEEREQTSKTMGKKKLGEVLQSYAG